jgi:uncharacterized Zn finger protein (UPF0148 family)
MSVVAIECKRCAGSLPLPGGGSGFVTCPYCGTSHVVSAPAMVITTEATGPSEYEQRRAAASSAWDTARQRSTDPVVALRAVVAVHAYPLKTEQELERAARLAEALLNGFDQTNATQVIADKDAALRMAEAVVKAVIELHSVPTTEVNLPFLIISPAGPLHLAVEVPRTKLVELDAMGVYTVKEAPAPPPAVAPKVVSPEPEAKAKRRWWPFK